MMDAIASMAMDMSAAKFSTEYALAMTKKTMDIQEMAGQELLNLLPQQSPMVPMGDFIDTYA